MLTEKQKSFCREYVRNNGNGTQAYLSAYNSNSETAASIESSKLLRRDDITEYILPTYIVLESVLFAPYFQSEKVKGFPAFPVAINGGLC